MTAGIAPPCTRQCGRVSDHHAIVKSVRTNRVFRCAIYRSSSHPESLDETDIILERELCSWCSVETTAASIEARES